MNVSPSTNVAKDHAPHFNQPPLHPNHNEGSFFADTVWGVFSQSDCSECFGKTPLPQKAVVLLGKSGGGKTTIIHALANKKLQVFHDTALGKTQLKSTDAMPCFTIGQTLQSQTSSPHVYVRSETARPDEKLALVDFPGFGDNRGVSQELSNAVQIQKTFSRFSDVQILAVVPDNDLMEPKATALMEFVRTIVTMFPNNADAYKSISLVVSQAHESRTENQVRAIFQQLVEELTLTPAERCLMLALREKVAIFKRPKTSTSEIFDTTEIVDAIFRNVRNNSFFAWNKSDICLSSVAKEEVIKTYTSITTKICEKLQECMSTFLTQVKRYSEQCVSKASQSQQRGDAQNDLQHLLEILEVVDSSTLDHLKNVIHKCQTISHACGENLREQERTSLEHTIDQAILLRKFIREQDVSPMNISTFFKNTMGSARSVVIGSQKEITEKIERERTAEEEERARVAQEEEIAIAQARSQRIDALVQSGFIALGEGLAAVAKVLESAGGKLLLALLTRSRR